MNHHQDIDDGLTEFEEQQDRDQAEERFRKQPKLFTKPFTNLPFEDGSLVQIALTGRRISDADTPLAFESGYMLLRGTVFGFSQNLLIRWDQGRGTEAVFGNL